MGFPDRYDPFVVVIHVDIEFELFCAESVVETALFIQRIATSWRFVVSKHGVKPTRMVYSI